MLGDFVIIANSLFLETTMTIIVSTIHCWLGACTSIPKWINVLADKFFSFAYPSHSSSSSSSQYTTTTPLETSFHLHPFCSFLKADSIEVPPTTLAYNNNSHVEHTLSQMTNTY